MFKKIKKKVFYNTNIEFQKYNCVSENMKIAFKYIKFEFSKIL